jgi:hypothetical protein
MTRSRPIVDSSLRTLGLRVLKTPTGARANAFCERLIGSAPRERLDFIIPVGEAHVRKILKEWTAHYNRSRPHSSLGPGIPNDTAQEAEVQVPRHRIPKNHRIVVTSILGSLQHRIQTRADRRLRTPSCKNVVSYHFCGPQRSTSMTNRTPTKIAFTMRKRLCRHLMKESTDYARTEFWRMTTEWGRRSNMTRRSFFKTQRNSE